MHKEYYKKYIIGDVEYEIFDIFDSDRGIYFLSVVIDGILMYEIYYKTKEQFKYAVASLRKEYPELNEMDAFHHLLNC